jgi:hypothetical protein
MKPCQVSSALPPDAAAALIAAAKKGAVAIDAATEEIMARYPYAYTDAAIREARERAATIKQS